jgi:hypothetical protein
MQIGHTATIDQQPTISLKKETVDSAPLIQKPPS